MSILSDEQVDEIADTLELIDALWADQPRHFIVRAVLDKAREALTNPPDAEVKHVARAVARARESNPQWRDLSGWERDCADVRAALAAAAGGDQ